MSALDDKSHLTTVAIVFAVAITCVAISLRFLARKLQKIPLGPDDFCMVIGAFFTVANALVYVWTNKYGNGRHVNTVEPSDLVLYWRTFYISYQLYGLAITAIKVSILLFYRRIFSIGRLRKWINIVGVLVLGWLFANNLVFAFQCTPVRKAWEIEIPGHCVNPLRTVEIIQVLNVVLDALVLALPVSGVLKLQMSTGRKISLIVTFLLGGLSVVIALVRVIILFNENLDDVTYKTSKCSWTAVEPAIEVLSGCLPTMAPLLHMRAHLKQFSSTLRSPFNSRSTTSGLDDIKTNRREYRHELNETKLRLGGEPAIISGASAKRSASASGEDDLVPLHSIKVRNDLEWKEVRNNQP